MNIEKSAQIAAGIRGAAAARAEVIAAVASCRQELERLRGDRVAPPKFTRCVTVSVRVDKPGMVDLLLSYQVQHAQWRPSYGVSRGTCVRACLRVYLCVC
jgi:hypothetical protein